MISWTVASIMPMSVLTLNSDALSSCMIRMSVSVVSPPDVGSSRFARRSRGEPSGSSAPSRARVSSIPAISCFVISISRRSSVSVSDAPATSGGMPPPPPLGERFGDTARASASSPGTARRTPLTEWLRCGVTRGAPRVEAPRVEAPSVEAPKFPARAASSASRAARSSASSSRTRRSRSSRCSRKALPSSSRSRRRKSAALRRAMAAWLSSSCSSSRRRMRSSTRASSASTLRTSETPKCLRAAARRSASTALRSAMSFFRVEDNACAVSIWLSSSATSSASWAARRWSDDTSSLRR
mmetsp:Transcript_19125/g.59383  ORF Transcript_19125/g.59383 Transcript_19125/m.59383 type:complete len:298 (+) Transcript_19125:586-1479(+)